MATRYKISCMTVIAVLVFILAPNSNYGAAEDRRTTIAEQSLFTPGRNEGIYEKPDPVKTVKKADVSHLELYGTVILGDKRSALIYDNSQQKMDEAQKQDGNKRAGVYYLGDSLGGYVITAIEEKRVVLDYCGEKVTLTLREGKKPAQGDVTPLEEATAGQQERAPEREDRRDLSAVPNTPVTSPIMSQEEAEEIVEFSREILDDMQKGGQDSDHEAIEEKKEELRKMFMEKLESTQAENR